MISNQAVKLAVCLLALTSTQALADILWDNAQPLSAGGPTNGLDSSVGPVGVGTYGLVTHEQALTGGGTRFISARTIGENVNGVTMNAYAAGSPSQAFADDVIVPMNILGGMGWDLSSAQIYAYAANGDGGLLQGAYAALYEVSPQGTVLNGNKIAGNIEPADIDGND
ncbi:MAG: hypothetical protein HC898_04450, partial [Phycisphaerales bacterium]|nr:hypothetical protein [Phycisphaerales bacterium]